MVVTCLLSIYLLNHFDNIYIKFTLGTLALSLVLDIIWLFMYASQKWNPPKVGNNSSYETQYLRFIVFFTVVVIILKVPLRQFRSPSSTACIASKITTTPSTEYQWACSRSF